MGKARRSMFAMALLGGCSLAAGLLAIADGTAGAQRSAADRNTLSGGPICRSAYDAATSSFQREMSKATADMHRAMHVEPTGDLDRDFASMMIPHHQGAVDMARTYLEFGRDERLRRLAQGIIVEQTQEITYMRSLLDAQRTGGAVNPDGKDRS
jgi:uncharacterized protein (DUF305 family)